MVCQRTGEPLSHVAANILTMLRHRLIGFEELGNSDTFDTAVLELRLSVCGMHCCCFEISCVYQNLGVIQKSSGSGLEKVYRVSASQSSRPGQNDDDIFDLDE